MANPTVTPSSTPSWAIDRPVPEPSARDVHALNIVLGLAVLGVILAFVIITWYTGRLNIAQLSYQALTILAIGCALAYMADLRKRGAGNDSV